MPFGHFDGSSLLAPHRSRRLRSRLASARDRSAADLLRELSDLKPFGITARTSAKEIWNNCWCATVDIRQSQRPFPVKISMITTLDYKDPRSRPITTFSLTAAGAGKSIKDFGFTQLDFSDPQGIVAELGRFLTTRTPHRRHTASPSRRP